MELWLTGFVKFRPKNAPKANFTKLAGIFSVSGQSLSIRKCCSGCRPTRTWAGEAAEEEGHVGQERVGHSGGGTEGVGRGIIRGSKLLTIVQGDSGGRIPWLG